MENKFGPEEVWAALVGLVRLAPQVEALVEQQSVQAQPHGWMTVAQAAEYTGLTQEAIRSALKSRALQRHTRGERSVALRREDLDAWMTGRS